MPNVTKIEAANHTPEAVRQILQDAREIACDLTDDELWQGRVFDKAVDLLGQKSVTFVAEQSQPLMAIPRNHRG